MTFIQKHLQNAMMLNEQLFKSASGHPVKIDYSKSTDNKIVGFVCFDTYEMPVVWDVNGKPMKLPLHQGLTLIPLRRVISYEIIPVDERV